MMKCSECGTDLSNEAKYCPNCGASVAMKKYIHHVSAEGLIGKVKELVKDTTVRRIIVKDEKGKVLLSIPVIWGAAG
jgi:predicted amidophosphoribosyltransferase